MGFAVPKPVGLEVPKPVDGVVPNPVDVVGPNPKPALDVVDVFVPPNENEAVKLLKTLFISSNIVKYLEYVYTGLVKDPGSKNTM